MARTAGRVTATASGSARARARARVTTQTRALSVRAPRKTKDQSVQIVRIEQHGKTLGKYEVTCKFDAASNHWVLEVRTARSRLRKIGTPQALRRSRPVWDFVQPRSVRFESKAEARQWMYEKVKEVHLTLVTEDIRVTI